MICNGVRCCVSVLNPVSGKVLRRLKKQINQEEIDQNQKLFDFCLREIGQMVTNGQYDEQVMEAKKKNAKFFEGYVKGLQYTFNAINQISVEA